MKGYTTSSIKKRGGGQVGDSYLNKTPPADWSVCFRCHAIYHKRHWLLSESKAVALLGKSRRLLCPACQKIQDHFSSGVITLRGNYLLAHHDEILNLVRNEEERARGFNPLERIVVIHEKNGTIEIETTTEKLAQRIGKRLHHAHHGEVHYKWSGNNRFIRVNWEREKQ